MRELDFKPLTAEQIEVRPTDTKTQGKCTLLLYIDSRMAARILNETVGVMNWQIEYKDVAGQIYGRLSIWDDERQMWVYREDTGSEGNIEAEKSLSSDILKRNLARWGCDYLYYTPKIKIDCPQSYYFNNKMCMTFQVNEIEFVGKECVKLVISDRFGNIVFNWAAGQQVQQQYTQPQQNQYVQQGSQDGRIPSWLWAKTSNAESIDALKGVWNDNVQYHNNTIFKSLVNKRKKELAA